MHRANAHSQPPTSNIEEVAEGIRAFLSSSRGVMSLSEIHIELPFEPVSLQANRSRKEIVTNAIRSMTMGSPFVLSGNLRVDIEWLTHPQERYEADASPDVDNVIKPILDAISGPQGIIIDDCQVQFVSCYWVDWERDDQRTIINIGFNADEWQLKEGLVFVNFGKGRCLPTSWPPSQALIDMVEKGLKRRDETGDYWASVGLMPIQRFYHISRLEGFKIIGLDDARAQSEQVGNA